MARFEPVSSLVGYIMATLIPQTIEWYTQWEVRVVKKGRNQIMIEAAIHFSISIAWTISGSSAEVDLRLSKVVTVLYLENTGIRARGGFRVQAGCRRFKPGRAHCASVVAHGFTNCGFTRLSLPPFSRITR